MMSKRSMQKAIAAFAVMMFLVMIPVALFSQESSEKPQAIKPLMVVKKVPAVLSTVGEKKNYNLQNYEFYAIGTIEYEPATALYKARVGFTGPEGFVFFNSYHKNFDDAHYMVKFIKDGKTSGKLYNIFAQTIEVHNTPTPGPHGETTVVEVLGIIYSFNH